MAPPRTSSAPGKALNRAAALLAVDGVLAVAIPNEPSLQARVFGDRWLALDLPRHLVHLPAKTLVHGMQASGLEIERVSYWRGGQVLFGWLHGMVAALPGHPDLYDALRRPGARRGGARGANRVFTLLDSIVCLPLATVAAAIEVAARRGGTVYVEGRRV